MRTHLSITFFASLAVAIVLSACSTKPAPARSSVASAATSPTNTAIIPVPRDTNWVKRHEGFVARAKQGNVDILFMGDSITDGWRNQNLWKEKYEPMKAVDFGIGGDRTEHVLWRMEHGELKGIRPKVIVLMIGTNNSGRNSVPEIVEGITAIVKDFRKRLPKSKILLLGIFPRAEKANNPIRQKLKDINAQIAKLDDGRMVRYLDIGDKFLDADGTLSRDIMPDFLHPNAKGYQIWADAMDPTLQAMLK
jgi:lysophospholipase L1-like esterase